ncbi:MULTISPECIES: hypothetical protein [unclassified Lentimonas]|uniref:hypothetical protein n=1 Tax=unclassified Lentimonas TaxID=2630993 RepID=UPI0013261D8F|nr:MULTISPECIES: hypothetical protein [unclassified Lentimonas]CAA6679202.1 Unannotated [Lentimonas sp. CC4]CAA6685866.1 Unannotated [Lentimonas sp. CC6]CAA7076043.1 Unannotated [Lentimonas sp. CC4]CAA7168524.1 Unannotated [Lentimonas sp. CC21]CAA7180918.1 Unannotated [Lentimonas sp. CC8]
MQLLNLFPELSTVLDGASVSAPRLSFAKHGWRTDIVNWDFKLLSADGELIDAGQNESLLLRRPNSGETGIVPHVFDGSCVFEQSFDLPKAEEGQAITLCFGGWNREDWQQYAVYLNDVLLLESKTPCGWHEPQRIVLQPEQADDAQLKFGAANTLRIEVVGLDRRQSFISEAALPIYLYDHFLCDQWIASGAPDVVVEDWQWSDWDAAAQSRTGRAQGFVLEQRCVREGAVLRIEQTLRNESEKAQTLLDVHLFEAQALTALEATEVGHPMALGAHGFIGLNHPTACLMDLPGNRVRASVLYGQVIAAGETLALPEMLLGVDATRTPQAQFHAWLNGVSPRGEEIFSMYDPYGHNDYGFGETPETRDLSPQQLAGAFEQLDRCAEGGLSFDYFVYDVGWIDPTGDFKEPRKDLFPEGFGPMVEAIKARGMQFGLWFSTSFADWGVGEHAGLEGSRIPGPNGAWAPREYFENGLLKWDFTRRFSLASDYADILEAGILHHIRENGLKLAKLDVGDFFSNGRTESQLPGKYSTRAMHDRLLQMARRFREEDPEFRLIWYWGARSPFFLTEGDLLFEPRLSMEGSHASELPCWRYRDSAQRTIDLGVANTPWLPQSMRDTLGIWLAQTTWGNHMETDALEVAMQMEQARGHLVFPQVWGDLSFLSDAQVAAMGQASAELKAQHTAALQPRQICGDPSGAKTYGYRSEPESAWATTQYPQDAVIAFDAVLLDTVTDFQESVTCAVPAAQDGQALMVLVEALDADGAWCRVESAAEWPQVQGLEWTRVCPAVDYIWKGSSWKYWASAGIVGDAVVTVSAPEEANRAVSQWRVQIGWVPSVRV